MQPKGPCAGTRRAAGTVPFAASPSRSGRRCRRIMGPISGTQMWFQRRSILDLKGAPRNRTPSATTTSRASATGAVLLGTERNRARKYPSARRSEAHESGCAPAALRPCRRMRRRIRLNPCRQATVGMVAMEEMVGQNNLLPRGRSSAPCAARSSGSRRASRAPVHRLRAARRLRGARCSPFPRRRRWCMPRGRG